MAGSVIAEVGTDVCPAEFWKNLSGIPFSLMTQHLNLTSLRPAGYRMAAGKRDTGSDAALGYARPGTYEEFLAVLSSAATTLPKRLRQVAVFLTQHPTNVALGTISTVAAEVGVQPSTLVRFAKIFGYSGFSEFQDLFKAHLKNGLAQGRSNRAAAGADQGRSASPAMSGLITAARTSLLRLDEDFDSDAFARVTEILAGAGLIYLIGAKRAFPVTAYMALTFSQHGVKTVLIDNIGSSALDQIGCLGAADAVLSVSFSPYNSTTPELTRIAAERGARVVAITDSMLSPLVALAEATFVVVEHSEAGYRSLAATMVTGLGLVLAVAGRRSESAVPPRGRAQGRKGARPAGPPAAL
jgi:DNA-binding MurR/RpiR family transcriptional regulator